MIYSLINLTKVRKIIKKQEKVHSLLMIINETIIFLYDCESFFIYMEYNAQ